MDDDQTSEEVEDLPQHVGDHPHLGIQPPPEILQLRFMEIFDSLNGPWAGSLLGIQENSSPE